MALDATPSGPNATAYLTAADADPLMRSFSPAVTDKWDAVPDIKNHDWILMRAAVLIDAYADWGPIKDDLQALAFPRTVDKVLVIPKEVKQATVEFVAHILEGEMDPIKKLQSEGVTSASILGQSTSFVEDRTDLQRLRQQLPAGARAQLNLLKRAHWPTQVRVRDDQPATLPGTDSDGTFFGGG